MGQDRIQEKAMSDGITVTVLVDVKPEEIEAACLNLPETVKDTAKFPGFRSIRILRHDKDRNRVLIVEQWDREEDFRTYVAWRQEHGGGLGRVANNVQIDIWPTVIASA